MNRLYLAKPYDGTENFSSVEAEFMHTMNLKTPETIFISHNNQFNRAYERIYDGLPQYFHYNGVDMEYIYPLDNKILSLSPLDISIPVLQPFRYTKFMKSLLKFDRIIFSDENILTETIKNEILTEHTDKFYILDGSKEFMEYNTGNELKFIQHYDNSDKLIRAIKSGDFSELKYRK